MINLLIQDFPNLIDYLDLFFILFEILLSLFHQNIILFLQKIIFQSQNSDFLGHLCTNLFNFFNLLILYPPNPLTFLQLLKKITIILIQIINFFLKTRFPFLTRRFTAIFMLPNRRAFILILQQYFINKLSQYLNFFCDFSNSLIFMLDNFLQSLNLMLILLSIDLRIIYLFLFDAIFNDSRLFNHRQLIYFILEVRGFDQIFQFYQILFILLSWVFLVPGIIRQQKRFIVRFTIQILDGAEVSFMRVRREIVLKHFLLFF